MLFKSSVRRLKNSCASAQPTFKLTRPIMGVEPPLDASSLFLIKGSSAGIKEHRDRQCRPGRPGQLSWRPRVLLGGGGGISSGSRRSASADGRGCPGGSYSGSGDSGVQGSFARRCPSFAERPVRLGARREGRRTEIGRAHV